MNSIYTDLIPMIPPFIPIHRVQILATINNINHQLMNIPAIWKHTKGAGIKAAVLDTGVSIHNDLTPVESRSFVNGQLVDENGHGCVSPETLVHTSFCGIETIEKLYNKIDMPEQLITHNDGYKSIIKDIKNIGIKTYSLDESTGKTCISPIEYIHKTPIDGEVVKITLEGGIEYKLTPWHEICVLKNIGTHGKTIVKRVRADKLKPGDRMIYSNGSKSGHLVSDYYRIEGSKYRICSNCGHILSQYKKRNIKCQCHKCFKNKWEEKKYSYFVTEDLAYLAGIVLTDGHITYKKNYRIEISSSTNEILNNVLIILKKLGFNGKIYKSKNRCSSVIIDSKKLADILINLGIFIHRKSYEQTLPEFVGKSPYSVICSFIAGVLDGDGCISKTNTKNRMTTVSKNFAEQFAALLNSIGVSCGIVNYGKSRWSTTDVYNCTFTAIPYDIAILLKHPRKKERALLKTHYFRIARNIKKIEKEKYNGFFYDFTVKDHHTYLGNGHFVSNTHCAGLLAAIGFNDMGVLGVAPEVSDYYVKILDNKGSGTIENVIKGIYFAVDTFGVNVINMSLGITHDETLVELEKACNYAADKNVIICAAAGNEHRSVCQPAMYDSVLAISSIKNQETISNFSNFGEQIDYCAVGENLYSTYLNNGYCTMSGTSMASPIIAGIVSLILSDAKIKGKNLTRSEAIEKLSKIAFDIGPEGLDAQFGHGIPIFKPEIIKY